MSTQVYKFLLIDLPTDSPSVDELNKLANLQHRRPKQPEGWWSRRLAYGLLFAIILALSVAAATQVTQETLAQKNFNAAFLLIWYKTRTLLLHSALNTEVLPLCTRVGSAQPG